MSIDPRGPAGISADPGPVSGYAWPQSVESGQPFGLHLSSTVGPVDVTMTRVGARRVPVHAVDALPVDAHPFPDDVTATGCAWPAAAEIDTTGWSSGYYEIALSGAEGQERSLAFVVVRSTAEAANRIVLGLSTNTWNAYNDVKSSVNLYTGGVVASFQRPLTPGFLHKADGVGSRVASIGAPDPMRIAHRGHREVHHLSDWSGAAGWVNWELHFVRWAEANGFAIDLATNADLEDPEFLRRYTLLLSVGHDEYWSKPMRDSVEGFVSAGGNVAFLSGNTSFWQVRIEDGGTVMVGYKDQLERDPLYGTDRQNEVTTIWSDRIVGRSENSMTGLSFTRGGYHRIGLKSPRGAGAYTVYRPEHWLFAGTALEYGDLLGAASTIVGYECDGCDFTFRDGLPYPTGVDGTPSTFEILATAPASLYDYRTSVRPVPPGTPTEIEHVAERLLGDHGSEACARIAHGIAVFGTYTRGGTVVTTGCTDWVHGLRGASPEVETITRNILERLG